MPAGVLHKMRVQLDQPVIYWMRRVDQDDIKLNDWIGRELTLSFTGDMYCIQCARKIRKTFQQGYCFPCMQRINECDNCMLHPERCHVEMGTCSPDDWAHVQCFEAHYVYLANSSGLKVGVTRHTHVPSRWIDQGASCALPILRVSNRKQAGLVEVAFKKQVNDKTHWHAMLKNQKPEIDLHVERIRLLDTMQTSLQSLMANYATGAMELLEHQSVVTIDYPVLEYPTKIVNLSFDKTPVISGQLRGIKGQYLIFDRGVLNIRKFGGYVVTVQS